jgi:hypothetical protein
MSTTLANLRLKLNGELGVATDAETTPWSKAVRNAAIADGYAALWRAGVWKAVTQDYPTVDGQVVYAACTARRLNRLELLDSDSNVVSRPEGFIESDGASANQLILRSGCAAGYTLRVYGWGPYSSSFLIGDTVTSSSVANPTVITVVAGIVGLYCTTGDTVTIAGHTGCTPSIAGDYELTVLTPTTFTIPVNVTVGGTGGTAICQYGSMTPDDLPAEFNRIPLLKAKAILYRQQLALFTRYGERQAVPPEMNMTIDQVLGVVAAAEREFTDECRALANLRPRVGQMRHL